MEDLDWQATEKAATDAVVLRIQEQRKALGVSSGELVRRVRDAGWPVNRTTFLNLLAFRRQSVGISELAAIAKALGVTGGMLAPDLADDPDVLREIERRSYALARTELVSLLTQSEGLLTIR